MRLIINGQDIELAPNVMIARTLQVNDIGSPETRQTSYTNTFSIPRTSKNTKTFDMLGIIGTDSNIPYQKNEAYLYDDSGFCLVYKGWAIISETAKDFKCNIYDGIIDFYKAIENKTLGDLDLSDLTHTKTPAEVASTQDKSKPYVYIVADYNGDSTSIDPTDIKSDYLIPCVKVPWIWEKIEQFSGFQLNGSFKTNTDFTNLYLTFPKNTPPIVGSNLLSGTLLDNTNEIDFYDRIIYGKVLSPYTIDSTKLLISGDGKTITALQDIKVQIQFQVEPDVLITPTSAPSYVPNVSFLGQTFACDGTVRNITQIIDLNPFTPLEFPMEFLLTPDFFAGKVVTGDVFISVTIKQVSQTEKEFEEFGKLTIKQFMNEILWRFNLTMFADKYTKQYTLKYLSEIINATPIDWSDKFDSLDSENYIYGNYAQRSYMKYIYNDVNDYNDYYLSIDNENLPDQKTVIQSDAYSPEFDNSQNLGFTTKVYKFWDKEIKDDSTVTYKSLQGRKYFLRATQVNTTVDFISDTLASTQSSTLYQKESFSRLSFTEIIQNYYAEMSSLLNQSKVFNVTLRLNEIDIVNMDFSKPVYIEQLGGSFLVNKISNFIPFKDTKVELIKISK